MNKSLFRAEVGAAQASAWLGEIRLAAPVSHTVWALCALVCGVAIVAWLVLGEYTRRERVPGQLVPVEGLARLKARSAGEVQRILVAEGQDVRQGDPLVVISGERYTEFSDGVADDVSAALEEQKATLRGDIDTARRTAEQQRRTLEAQIALLETQIASAADELAIYRADADEQQKLLDKIEPLARKGYVSETQVQQLRSMAASARATVARQQAQQSSLAQQLRDLRGRLEQVPLQMATQLNDANRQLARADGDSGRNEADRSGVIRAPADGAVSALLVRPGQSVTAGTGVLTLLPKGATIEAELLVRSAAVGFVEARQPRRGSLPRVSVPEVRRARGTVRAVSRNALTPAEVSELTGLNDATEPLYRVRVALNEQSVSAYGEQRPLLAGMGVDGDILLDRRRLYEWLFEPIYSLGKRNTEIQP